MVIKKIDRKTLTPSRMCDGVDLGKMLNLLKLNNGPSSKPASSALCGDPRRCLFTMRDDCETRTPNLQGFDKTPKAIPPPQADTMSHGLSERSQLQPHRFGHPSALLGSPSVAMQPSPSGTKTSVPDFIKASARIASQRMLPSCKENLGCTPPA